MKTLHRVFAIAATACLSIAPCVAAADCLCTAQTVKGELLANGRPLLAGSKVPCGTLVASKEGGSLGLADGMSLDFLPGASIALAPVLCGETGSLQPSSIVGMVELLMPEGSSRASTETVTAGFRDVGSMEQAAGQVVRIEGMVTLLGKGEPPLPLQKDALLYPGESVKTENDGFAQLRLRNGSVILLGPGQTYAIQQPRGKSK